MAKGVLQRLNPNPIHITTKLVKKQALLEVLAANKALNTDAPLRVAPVSANVGQRIEKEADLAVV